MNEVATQNTALTQEDLEVQAFLEQYANAGTENLNSSDIIIPRFSLVQNTSKKGDPGKFFNAVTEENLDSLSCIVLNISNYRVYFPSPYSSGDKPLCRSSNGATKDLEEGVGSGNCANCQYAKWGKDANGSTVKPPCQMGYTLLLLVADKEGNFSPALFNVKGASIKNAKAFFTRIKAKPVPPWAYYTEITAHTEISDKGRYFVTKFDIGENLSKPQLMEVAKIYESMKDFNTKFDVVDREAEEEPVNVTNHSILDDVGNMAEVSPLDPLF